MNDVVNILHICFVVCLAIAILFLIISIVLFFLFDIKTIFNIRTGRAEAKVVKEMKKANDSTGRLRVGKQTLTTKLSKDERNRERAPAVIPPERPAVQAPPAQPVEQIPAAPVAPVEEIGETEVLSGELNAPEETGETTLLSGTTGEVKNYNTDSQPASNINFTITREVVLIHTDERIY